MLSTMRKAMRDEAGQALVLGALAMVVLALSVMVTLQLGHAISKRIEVQNAADNAAFSVAAVVARSLNAIAWMNRTIIAHYVSMMALQSMISALNGIHALVGIASDMFQSAASAVCVIKRSCQVCCESCGAIPYAGPALAAAACACEAALSAVQPILERGAEMLRRLADEVMQPLFDGFDKMVAEAVTRIGQLNGVVMLRAQQGIRAMTVAALGSITAARNFQKAVIDETARNANTRGVTATAYNAAMGGLNAAGSYWKMFDHDGSESIPEGTTYYSSRSESDDDAGVKPAERLMAELANATRTGAGRTSWESGRGLTRDGAGSLFASVMRFLDFEHQGSTRLVLPMSKSTFREEDGADGGSGDGRRCEAKARECESKQAGCDSARAAYESAEADLRGKQAQCDSDTWACDQCSDTSCPACAAKAASCAEASSARQLADQKVRELERSCGDMKDACEAARSCAGSVPGQDLNGASKKNYVFMNGGGASLWSRGTALASAEYVRVGLIGLEYLSGGGGSKIVGIQAAPRSNDSFHCVYGKGTTSGSCDGQGRRKIEVEGCPWYAWSCPITCDSEGFRHVYGGIARYVSFEAEDDPSTLFNQPDYWALINLAPQDARLPAELAFGFDSSGSFSLSAGGRTGRLTDMDKPGLSTRFGEGLNGWSRAQVYYHRPGYWAEPPNLFNPFWRAKLAPVAPKLDAVAQKLGNQMLGRELRERVEQVITH